MMLEKMGQGTVGFQDRELYPEYVRMRILYTA